MIVAMPVYAICYLAVTHFVLAEHLSSYRHTWGGLYRAQARTADLLLGRWQARTADPLLGRCRC